MSTTNSQQPVPAHTIAEAPPWTPCVRERCAHMAEVALTGPGGTEYLCGSDFGYARDRITFSEPRGTVTDTTGSVADLKAAAGDAYSIVMTGGGRLVATDARTCETVAAYTVARLRRMIGGAP